MQKKVYFFILSFVVFGLALSFSNCSSKKDDIKISQEPPVLVRVLKLEKKTVSDKTTLIGQLEGEREIDVLPDISVSGIVKNIKVVEGSKVRKGSFLMEIDQQAVTGRSYRQFTARAKISGFISRVYVEEGTLVTPQTKLCRIIQMDRMKVIIDVPEADISKVRKGQKVEIELDKDASPLLEGKIDRIYPALDPATLTLRVEVILSNKGFKLKSGMFVTVDILFGNKSAILIPLNSLIVGDNVSYVFVYDPTLKLARSRIIRTGKYYGNEIEVLSGLNEGELIVVEGNYQINDGEKVKLATR